MNQSFKNFRNYFVLIVTSLTLLGIAYFYFSSKRFYISNTGDNKSYKIDRWTGKTWLLINGEQIRIDKDEEDPAKTDSQKAINLAKRSYDLPNTDLTYDLDNDYAIYSILSGLKGDLNILGWSSQKITDQTYLVSYEYEHNGQAKSHNFDVNLSESIVRYVNEDPYLLNKYQKYISNYSSLRYFYDELVRSEKVKGLPDFETFEKQLTDDKESRKKFYNGLKETYIFMPKDFETFNKLYFSN